MQTGNRLFDDLARVAAGAAGAIGGMRSEVESRLRDQLERLLAGMDLVSREEFEAVKAMAARAREEQDALLRRIETLEAQRRSADTQGEQPPAGAGDAKS